MYIEKHARSIENGSPQLGELRADGSVRRPGPDRARSSLPPRLRRPRPAALPDRDLLASRPPVLHAGQTDAAPVGWRSSAPPRSPSRSVSSAATSSAVPSRQRSRSASSISPSSPAGATLFVRHPASGVALGFAAAIVLAIVAGQRSYALLAYLLITIVHVFVFTAVSCSSARSKVAAAAAFISLGVFIACALDAPRRADAGDRGLTASIRAIYADFDQLNRVLVALFGGRCDGRLAIMRLDRVRLHVPLPELVLEDVDHPLARGAAQPRGGDRRRSGLGGSPSTPSTTTSASPCSTSSASCTSCSSSRSTTRRSSESRRRCGRASREGCCGRGRRERGAARQRGAGSPAGPGWGARRADECNAECRMKNEELTSARRCPFSILHSAFCILHSPTTSAPQLPARRPALQPARVGARRAE